MEELLESGNSPWGTHVGQYHSSGLIHCPGHYHRKYSVDHVVECSEISAHGLEKEICPAKLAPKGCWFLVRIGGLSEIIKPILGGAHKERKSTTWLRALDTTLD